MKFLLKVVICSFVYYQLALFCTKQTEGFTIARITTAVPQDAKWDVAPLTEELRKELQPIFNQNFKFLGSGGQCYAFASDDGRYVLKCFKCHHLNNTNLLSTQKKQAKCTAKLYRDFTSYKLSFDELKEESGIVFLHLNPTDHLHQSVTLIDKLNIAHTLDLDKLCFLIQKKAELVYPHITALMSSGQVEAAKQASASIIQLIINRCKKGIFDEDAKIHRNFGFIDNQAILIDVGRLKPDASRMLPETYKQDAYIITQSFRLWLAQNHPALLENVEQHLSSIQ